MTTIAENILALKRIVPANVKLVAVSKTKPVAEIMEAYTAGQRCFGENYVQELIQKIPLLPEDIEWHFIGHLQTNKVKLIVPHVHYIHAVDSEKLLTEIGKQAEKNNRKIRCLLQVHIAREETKFGWDPDELIATLNDKSFTHPFAPVCGLMGMATFTEEEHQIRNEFRTLKKLFDEMRSGVFNSNMNFTELSMGMSSDWNIAVEEGSTMIRVGSAIFGERT